MTLQFSTSLNDLDLHLRSQSTDKSIVCAVVRSAIESHKEANTLRWFCKGNDNKEVTSVWQIWIVRAFALLLFPVVRQTETPMLAMKVAIVLFVGCLSSQQHASVSQGRICTDNFTCCHTEIEAADPTLRLTQSQYTDTGPTSPSADPITPGAWQGSHWSGNF